MATLILISGKGADNLILILYNCGFTHDIKINAVLQDYFLQLCDSELY